MIKSLYECCGWSADEPILCDEGVLVKLHVNSELILWIAKLNATVFWHKKRY